MILERYVYRCFLRQFIPLWGLFTLGYLLLCSEEIIISFQLLESPIVLIGLLIILGTHQTLPVSIIITFVMIFARFKKDGELEAIKTSGYKITRLYKPVLLATITLVIIHSILSNFLVPFSLYQRKKLKWKNNLNSLVNAPLPQATELKITPLVSISYKSLKDGVMRGVILRRVDDYGNLTEEYNAVDARLVTNEFGQPEIILSECNVTAYLGGKKESELKNKKISFPISKYIEQDTAIKQKHVITTQLILSNPEAIKELFQRFIVPLTLIALAILSSTVGMRANVASSIAGLAISMPLIIIFYLLHLLLAMAYEKNSFLTFGMPLIPTIIYLTIYSYLSIMSYKKLPT